MLEFSGSLVIDSFSSLFCDGLLPLSTHSRSAAVSGFEAWDERFSSWVGCIDIEGVAPEFEESSGPSFGYKTTGPALDSRDPGESKVD